MSNAKATKQSEVTAHKEGSKARSNADSHTEVTNPLWRKMILGDTESPYLQRKCAACDEEASQVQTKLTVGPANDQFEREADAVSDQVMRMPIDQEGGLHNTATISSISHPSAQSKSSGVSNEASSNVESTVQSPGIGSMLNSSIQKRAEPVLNSDLSHVQVHKDAAANAAAQDLNARAFTHKNHVFLASGESEFDLALMSHEATHVIQQTGHVQRKPENIDKPHEKDKQKENTSIGHSSVDIQNDPQQHIEETYEQFEARVRALAVSRLSQNIAVLNEWSSYVRSMEGFQLQAQLITSLVTDYALTANQTPSGQQRFETFAGTDNESERAMHGSQLASDSSYRERAGSFMDFLGSKTQGYTTSPSVASRMQVMAGDRSEAGLPESQFIGADPRYAEYVGPYERYQSGESGGCQTCHDINLAYQRTADMYGDPLPSGPIFSEFPTLFNVADFSTNATGDGNLGTDNGSLTVSDQQMMQRFIESMAVPEAVPEEANPYLPSVPIPQAVELPAPRTNLCGPLPKAEEESGQHQFNPSLWGRNSAIVADVIGRINAALVPLGPQGYRVIRRRSFDRLWAAGPGELETIQNEIIADISARQGQYRELQDRIRSGDVPFTDLCPIVDQLLPSTSLENKIRVRREIAEQRAIEFLISAVDLTLLAFAIIYPPSIIVTLPLRVGLALTKLAVGPGQIRRGQDVNRGAHSGVFSPSQEARADADITMGWANILSGGLDLVGIGASRYLRRPPTTTGFQDELLANGWRQEAGILWTHPSQRNMIWQSGNTFELVDEAGVAVGRVTEMPDGMQILERLGAESSAAATGSVGFGSRGFGHATSTSMVPSATSEATSLATTPSSLGAGSSPLLTAPAEPFGLLPSGAAASSGQIHYGSRIILPSNAPAPGQAPAYSLPLGADGNGGVMLMNRGLTPNDFANNGFRGSTIADDPTQLRLWMAAEQQLANSPQNNVYKRWLAAVDDGSVHSWTSEELGAVYSSMWNKYKVLARGEGIDVATIHHWNYNKADYPLQVVDPRNLMPVYGQSSLRGGYHPAHQGALHPLTSSGHPTNDPVAQVHELPLRNYDVPRPNSDYPGMPDWWHPPMAQPEGAGRLPFGWDPMNPPQWNWPPEYQELYPYLTNRNR